MKKQWTTPKITEIDPIEGRRLMKNIRNAKFYKLLFYFCLALALILIAQLFTGRAYGQKPVVEIFINNQVAEYMRVQDICDSLEYPYIVHHYHSNDPLSNIQSKERWYDRGTGNIPEGFVNGLRLSSLTDPQEYVSLAELTSPYSCEISVSGDFVLQSNLTVLLNWDIRFTGSGYRVFIYIVEDLCSGGHRRVMQRMLPTEGIDFRDRLNISTLADNDWDVTKSYLIITVEDSQRRVIGMNEINLKSSVTTGINNIDMSKNSRVWPNPASERLKFSDNLTFKSIIDQQGRRVEVDPPEGNELNISHLRAGYYMAVFNAGISDEHIGFIKK